MGPFRGISTADSAGSRRGRLYAALPVSDDGQEDEVNPRETSNLSVGVSNDFIERVDESEKTSAMSHDQLTYEIAENSNVHKNEHAENDGREGLCIVLRIKSIEVVIFSVPSCNVSFSNSGSR